LKPILVIKLGGSALTKKDKVFSLRDDVLEMVAAQLRELIEVDKEKVIVIHGGGSFGHPVASAYSMNKGYTSEEQLTGYSKVRRAMLILHVRVLEKFLEYGIPIAPFSPSNFIVTRKGKVIEFTIKPIRNALSLGLVPLLHGDVVMDVDLGFYIVSGDQLAFEIARRMPAKKVVFGADVKGIYTENPKISNKAELIRVLKATSKIRLETTIGNVADVTGGISRKLSYAIALAKIGIPVVIGDITKEGGLLRLIRGIEEECTLIIP